MGRERVALVIGGVGAAVLGATLVPALATTPSGPEIDVARLVYDLPSWSTGTLRLIMQVGARGAIVVVVAALILAGRRRPAAIAGLAGAGGWLVARVLKEVVDRPRPSVVNLERPLREMVEGSGYPSTHAAVVTALVVAVILTLPMPRAAAWALALLAGFTAVARVHLGVHWPLDVVGGWGIGLLAGSVAATLGGRCTHPAATGA